MWALVELDCGPCTGPCSPCAQRHTATAVGLAPPLVSACASYTGCMAHAKLFHCRAHPTHCTCLRVHATSAGVRQMPCGILAAMRGMRSRRHCRPVQQQPAQAETRDVSSSPAPGELYILAQLLLPILGGADKRSLRATCKVGTRYSRRHAGDDWRGRRAGDGKHTPLPAHTLTVMGSQ